MALANRAEQGGNPARAPRRVSANRDADQVDGVLDGPVSSRVVVQRVLVPWPGLDEARPASSRAANPTRAKNCPISPAPGRLRSTSSVNRDLTDD